MKIFNCYIVILLTFCIIKSNQLEYEIDSDQLIRQFDSIDMLDDLKETKDLFNEDSNNDQYNSHFVAISLGHNCHAASFLRTYNIRPFAFPFDWCLTPYQALYNFIENDFKDYYKKENLVPGSMANYSEDQKNFLIKFNYFKISESPTWVLDKASGMIFNHDFSNNQLSTIYQEYEIQYAKYVRRIKRFYEIINSGKHIYFVRYWDINKADAIKLYELLKNKFPFISFTLIVIDNSSESKEDWNITGIKNFFGADYGQFGPAVYKFIVAGK